MDTLAELTNQALSDHAGAAAQAARQLSEGLPGVLGAASAEELEAALRAIEHIGLGHLADADWTERQGALVAAEAAREIGRAHV